MDDNLSNKDFGERKYIVGEDFLFYVRNLIDASRRMTVTVPSKMTEISCLVEELASKALYELINVVQYKHVDSDDE